MGMLLSMFPLWLVGLWLLACIGLCVHVVRSGRELFWLWIILVFQPLGAVVYLVAIFLPELLRGSDAQRLLGRANALLALNRGAEAIAVLEKLGADPEAHSPAATLAFGRAYEAVGRQSDAARALKEASERVPGFEGMARYAAFLARSGRRDEARAIVDDLDRRMTRLRGHFRKEAQQWRELAARALAN